MSAKIYFENKIITLLTPCNNIHDLKQTIFKQYGIPYNHMYVTINGKLADPGVVLHESNIVRMCTRLIGGKGGFGSMLRAIGAQIEKTTNREACRDLSGRRLRDINEEKRLRKWLEGQEEREREAIERKQKKLEKLLAEPKIEVSLNPSYEKERQELPERVSSAVDAGWQVAGTSGERKRKSDEVLQKKKKAKLWIDAELSDCSSSSESDNESPNDKIEAGAMSDSSNKSELKT